MKVSLKSAIAEAFATALFVYIGTGTATTFGAVQTAGGFTLPTSPRSQTGSNPEQNTQILLDNIIINPSWVLCYATTHLSGGQLNPAVTLGLALFVGAIMGSALLMGTIPGGQASTLGTNMLAPSVGVGNAALGEIVMTLVLVSVVMETAVNKKSLARAQAPLAIGFAVFCAHAVLLPIDGCSINPARALGPAIVSGTWTGSFWVMVICPFIGAIFAVPFHYFFRSDWDTLPKTPQDVAVGLSPAQSLDTGAADIVAQAKHQGSGVAMAAGGGLASSRTISKDPELALTDP